MTTFETPTGGILCAGEIGAITGAVELFVTLADGSATVEAAYAETDERYPVDGSPVAALPGEDEAALVARIVAHLTRDPGVDVHGNPRVTTLRDLA